MTEKPLSRESNYQEVFELAYRNDALEKVRVVSPVLAQEIDTFLFADIYPNYSKDIIVQRLNSLITEILNSPDPKIQIIRDDLGSTIDENSVVQTIDNLVQPFRELSTAEGRGYAILKNFSADAFVLLGDYIKTCKIKQSDAKLLKKILSARLEEIHEDEQTLRSLSSADSEYTASNLVSVLLASASAGPNIRPMLNELFFGHGDNGWIAPNLMPLVSTREK